MREFFAKIARHAFGKGAAFCYAVTVAVSGQLAYNYLQPRNTAPMPVSVVVPVPAPASDSGAAIVAPIPAARPSAPPLVTAPILPDPSSLSLPSPAALPVPALKAAVLPPAPAEKPVSTVAAKPASLPDMPPLDMPLHPQPAEAARPAGTADVAVAAPIPLLPATGAAEVEKAAVPIRPGPGSGGLY